MDVSELLDVPPVCAADRSEIALTPRAKIGHSAAENVGAPLTKNCRSRSLLPADFWALLLSRNRRPTFISHESFPTPNLDAPSLHHQR
jgi:hypothetical protein